MGIIVKEAMHVQMPVNRAVRCGQDLECLQSVDFGVKRRRGLIARGLEEYERGHEFHSSCPMVKSHLNYLITDHLNEQHEKINQLRSRGEVEFRFNR